MKEIDFHDCITQPELIGANLRALRVAHDCTLEEVARKTSLSKPFLSLVESGKRSIRSEDLRRVVMVFGFSLGYFLSQVERSLKEIPQSAPVVSGRESSILLDGKRKEDAYSLLLMRIMNSADDTQVLRLHLPPCSQMSDSYISIDAPVRGVVSNGCLLLEIRGGDEYLVREGEEFLYDGKREHVLRNHTVQSSTSYLWIEGGKF